MLANKKWLVLVGVAALIALIFIGLFKGREYQAAQEAIRQEQQRTSNVQASWKTVYMEDMTVKVPKIEPWKEKIIPCKFGECQTSGMSVSLMAENVIYRVFHFDIPGEAHSVYKDDVDLIKDFLTDYKIYTEYHKCYSIKKVSKKSSNFANGIHCPLTYGMEYQAFVMRNRIYVFVFSTEPTSYMKDFAFFNSIEVL